jgi:hypothetical protein
LLAAIAAIAATPFIDKTNNTKERQYIQPLLQNRKSLTTDLAAMGNQPSMQCNMKRLVPSLYEQRKI